MKKLLTLIALVMSLAAGAAYAQNAPAQDPQKLAQTAITIAKELRCPASVNQSLYDSEQPLAAELKARIYQMLQQGKTKEEIFSFFAKRYGEQIRYSPEVTPSTSMLWILPAGLVILILGWALLVFKRRKSK